MQARLDALTVVAGTDAAVAFSLGILNALSIYLGKVDTKLAYDAFQDRADGIVDRAIIEKGSL